MIPNGGKTGHWGVPQWEQIDALCLAQRALLCQRLGGITQPVLVGGGNPKQREHTLLEGGAGYGLRLLQLRC